jgi:hypothetical protein
MKVDFSDLLLAFEFVSSGASGQNTAEWLDDDDQDLLDDIEDPAKYFTIPDKRELDLGKPLVLKFTRHHLPDDYDKVQEIFSRKGAYARFKDLLEARH